MSVPMTTTGLDLSSQIKQMIQNDALKLKQERKQLNDSKFHLKVDVVARPKQLPRSQLPSFEKKIKEEFSHKSRLIVKKSGRSLSLAQLDYHNQIESYSTPKSVRRHERNFS